MTHMRLAAWTVNSPAPLFSKSAAATEQRNAFLSDRKPLPIQYRAIIKRKDGEKAMVMEVFVCLNYSGEIRDSEETSPVLVEIDKINTLNLISNVNNAIQQAIKFLA